MMYSAVCRADYGWEHRAVIGREHVMIGVNVLNEKHEAKEKIEVGWQQAHKKRLVWFPGRGPGHILDLALT